MVPSLSLTPGDLILTKCMSYKFFHVPQTTPALLQSRANVYVAHSPAGTSVQNILHWSQVGMMLNLSFSPSKYLWEKCPFDKPGVISYLL